MGSENRISHIIPVMLTFFTMGFVDLVGIATLVSGFLGSDRDVNEQDRTEKNCIIKYGHYVYWIVDSYLCL